MITKSLTCLFHFVKKQSLKGGDLSLPYLIMQYTKPNEFKI